MRWHRMVLPAVLFLFLNLHSNAQPRHRRLRYGNLNTIDMTYGGSGLYVSANYSRKILEENDYFINASVGAGSFIGLGGLTLAQQVTFNYGRGNNYLEAGLGGSYRSRVGNIRGMEDRFSCSISPILGYRRDLVGGFVFRIYINPLIRVAGDYFYWEWPVAPYSGLSLGYSF
jgi:hypothetical protein